MRSSDITLMSGPMGDETDDEADDETDGTADTAGPISDGECKESCNNYINKQQHVNKKTWSESSLS